MYDLILRRARLIDDQLVDIALQDGKIAAIGALDQPARQVKDLEGRYYVSAGWIDSHVHCYPDSPIYHDEPDRVGVSQGVTTVIDAGSAGCRDIDAFRALAAQATTHVYAFLNISRIGLEVQSELADMSNIDEDGVRAALARHPDFIVGLKARMSSSVVGQNGLAPLQRAKAIQQANGNLPLMVHVGNPPPDLDDIADLLTAGDIITHCYNGKPNRILTPQGELRASIQRALRRGVRLDVGHGSASLCFDVARRAIEMGILPHTISSDIYCKNRLSGPVYSLAWVMSKFLSLGMTPAQVIDCVTAHAAEGLRLTQKGRLEVGCDADLTIFALRAAPCVFDDSEGDSLTGEHEFVPLAAIVAGHCMLTEKGESEDGFCL